MSVLADYRFLTGGKAFGLLKSKQEEKLNSINEVSRKGQFWLCAEHGGCVKFTTNAEINLFHLQVFLSDPKYVEEEDLGSKLEAFKSKGSVLFNQFH